MNYRLRPNVALVERDGGLFLTSQTPLCVLRLNRSLADLLRGGRDGCLPATTAAEQKVMEQLTAKGFAERVRTVDDSISQLPEVSIIIPVMNRAGELRRCLSSLGQLAYPREKLQVIVVDDGSSDDSPAVADDFGATVVPSGGRGRGPAAARNVGAAIAGGDILAFIDSDCTASRDWLAELLPVFSDPKIVAVGGLVEGMCRESAVDHYENVMSSLSLGKRELTGGSGDDTFYLPSCNLLVRRAAFIQASGFNDTMHVGEDVDLTWRLRDRGWTIAYLPAGRVYHEHRSSIRSFMSRRFDYGTSEGMLQQLHPRRRKQMVVPPMLALVLATVLVAPFAGWWLILPAAGVLLADCVLTRVRLTKRDIPIGFAPLLAGRLRAFGSLLYYLCYHLVRYYAVPLALVVLIAPGVWAAVFPVATLLCAAGIDFAIRKPRLTFGSFCGIYLLEQLAYGSGVFWGCLKRRCFASYRIVMFRQAELAV